MSTPPAFRAAGYFALSYRRTWRGSVLSSFVLPVLIIIMLINFVAWDSKPGAGSDGLSAEAIARRIQPVGVSDFKDPTDVKSLKTGEQVFQAQCTACHTSVCGSRGASMPLRPCGVS